MLKGNPAYKKLAGVQGKAKKKNRALRPARAPRGLWPVVQSPLKFTTRQECHHHTGLSRGKNSSRGTLRPWCDEFCILNDEN
jgi:hypothetical protein